MIVIKIFALVFFLGLLALPEMAALARGLRSQTRHAGRLASPGSD